MNDPSAYWLIQTNILLGVVTLICVLAVGFGVVQELAARHRRNVNASELDRDLAATFGDGHAFHMPELGLTMADGGEELKTGEATKEEKR